MQSADRIALWQQVDLVGPFVKADRFRESRRRSRARAQESGASEGATMLSFCPHCANMLLVDHCPEGGGLKLYCQT